MYVSASETDPLEDDVDVSANQLRDLLALRRLHRVVGVGIVAEILHNTKHIPHMTSHRENRSIGNTRVSRRKYNHAIPDWQFGAVGAIIHAWSQLENSVH